MSGYLPNHLMVRFTAIAVLVTASTSTGAEQKDVLIVVLDVNGEQSMRFQLMGAAQSSLLHFENRQSVGRQYR